MVSAESRVFNQLLEIEMHIQENIDAIAKANILDDIEKYTDNINKLNMAKKVLNDLLASYEEAEKDD